LNKKIIKKSSRFIKYFEVFFPLYKTQKKLKKGIIRRIFKKLFFHKYPLYLEVNYKILHSLFFTIKNGTHIFLPFKRKQKELFKKKFSYYGNPYRKRVVNTPVSATYGQHYYIERN